MDKRADARKKQNDKDKIEIEKLKTKLDNLTKERVDLVDQINNLRV